MSSKRFLAVGNILINPDLLAYATFEDDEDGPRLRLGFATGSGASTRAEVRLAGDEAGVALRWLRLNSTYLTLEGAFGPVGPPAERPISGKSLEAGPVNHAARSFAG